MDNPVTDDSLPTFKLPCQFTLRRSIKHLISARDRYLAGKTKEERLKKKIPTSAHGIYKAFQAEDRSNMVFLPTGTTVRLLGTRPIDFMYGDFDDPDPKSLSNYATMSVHVEVIKFPRPQDIRGSIYMKKRSQDLHKEIAEGKLKLPVRGYIIWPMFGASQEAVRRKIMEHLAEAD